MLNLLKNSVVILLLVGVVFAVSHYAGPVKNQLFSMLNLSESDVKGASTQRAEELTQQFSSDIGEQIDAAKDDILETKVSDVLNGLSRLQKISHDATNLKDYVSDQVSNFLNK